MPWYEHTVLQQWEQRSLLEHYCMILYHINTTITYAMWCEEHLRNVSVLRRLYLSNLVRFQVWRV
jgi:hypothetical protein